MKLKKIISFDGTVECVTGIAIKGAGNDMGIGGADSEVIKNPLTNEIGRASCRERVSWDV